MSVLLFGHAAAQAVESDRLVDEREQCRKVQASSGQHDRGLISAISPFSTL